MAQYLNDAIVIEVSNMPITEKAKLYHGKMSPGYESKFPETDPEESRHINHWLADNCFGDYYTRSQHEIGNDKAFLIKAISQCLLFIGYLRSMNALRCVNDACK